MKLSIIVPVFNEKRFIRECIKTLVKKKLSKILIEIIVSDNNSNDGTKKILKEILLKNKFNIKILFQNTNLGKGSNIKNALKYATGEYILIQDADLEYSPNDYISLLKPILSGKANVVYGNRFSGSKDFHVYSFIHLLANKLLTLFTNILFNKSFSDVLTGYKVIKTEIIKNINLSSNSFDFDTEITAKICSMKNIKIYEVPISIYSRKYSEGKKIKWWHFLILTWSLLKWRVKLLFNHIN